MVLGECSGGCCRRDACLFCQRVLLAGDGRRDFEVKKKRSKSKIVKKEESGRECVKIRDKKKNSDCCDWIFQRGRRTYGEEPRAQSRCAVMGVFVHRGKLFFIHKYVALFLLRWGWTRSQ
jgi:hypothetical protein